MNKIQAALLGLLAVSISGCAAYGPKVDSSYESYDKDYTPQIVTLASEVAEDIAIQYPNKLVFVDATHKEGSFADLLRRSLASRKALAITSPMSDVRVRYAIEELEKGLGYLNLRFDDGSAKTKTFFLIPPNTYGLAAPAETLEQIPLSTPMPSDFNEKSEVAVTSLKEEAPIQDAKAEEQGVKEPADSAAVLALDEAAKTQEKALPAVEPVTTHVVQKDETVAKIARKYGISFGALCKENGGIEKCQLIKPGQILKLPHGTMAEKKPAMTDKPISIPTPVVESSPAVEAAPSAAPVTVTAPSSVKGIIPRWTLTPGSLRTQIQKWCAASGYQLVWNTTSDLDMEASSTFFGDFTEAISQLFDGLHDAGHALTVKIYKGNSVLEVGDK